MLEFLSGKELKIQRLIDLLVRWEAGVDANCPKQDHDFSPTMVLFPSISLSN